jgi:YD repeat-containing protein
VIFLWENFYYLCGLFGNCDNSGKALINVVVLRPLKRLFFTAFAILLICQACGPEYGPQECGVQVAFGVADSFTKTSPDDSYTHFTWDKGDQIALWAKASDESYTLSAQTFNLYASTDSPRPMAWFTSTLVSTMPDGTYTYYMCYPLPDSVSGTSATFSVPAHQDGALSAGEDIIIARPVEWTALAPIDKDGPIGDGISVQMKHLLHFLRFYIPEGNNILGEPVQKITFTMPQSLAGTVTVDVTDASSATLSDGKTTVTVDLKETLQESTSTERQYAGAAIFPPSGAYSASDRLEVKIFSENNYAKVSYSLSGRSFEAGHVTSVALRPTELGTRYKIAFALASNNLGEEPQTLTLTLPEGVNWPGTGSNVYTYAKSDGSLIQVGDSFYLDTIEESEFRALSGQTVTVSYDSESALVSQTLTLADLTSVNGTDVTLDCPYLFFEDFSTVESFNSGDKHSSSNIGSKDPKVFNGWSVARAGAQAGTAIRLAAHREWFENYPARCDSPFLSGLKEGKTVSLDVQFDYSMGREEGGLGSGTNASQTVHLGYITTSDNLKSDDETGTWTSNFELNETTGSYTNINHLSQTTLTDVQSPLRLSWRTITPTYKATTNSTCWLYIDNVKVKIIK